MKKVLSAKISVLMIAMLVLLTGTSHALLGVVDIEAAVGGWYAAPSGSVFYDAGDDVNIEDSMGFEDDFFPAGRLRLDLPLVIPNIYVIAQPMEFDDNLSDTVNFGGYDFQANADTKLTLNQYDVALFYGIPFLGLATLGNVNIDVGLNFRIIDVEASITESTTGRTESESQTLPIPMVFVAAQIEPIDAFAIEAELRALSIGDAEVISAIGRFRYNAFGPLFLAAGYRYDDISVDHDDLEVDIDMSGLFAEVGVKF